MAFTAAVGWNNLPNGVWSPTIYSKKVQLAFRKKSVVQDITNSDYFGEIADFGDSVKIIKEPDITVAPYGRGQQITSQDLLDDDFTLIIDKANYFAFKVDDIETKQSHINWESLASNRAGYKMSDQFDQDILGYMTGYKQSAYHLNADTVRVAADVPGTPALDSALTANELLAVNRLKKGDFSNITTSSAGDHSIPVQVRFPGATAYSTSTVSPMQIMNRASRLMDQQNVPKEGRWVVLDPVFVELLKDEDSRLLNADWGKSGGIRNGRVTDGEIYGFRVYESNNLPKMGTGPSTAGTANQDTNYGVIVFGNDQAVATAEQIRKTETLRDHDFFGDIVRGMHLYGRKILRPESIVTAKYNVA
jgi:hypothetical protein